MKGLVLHGVGDLRHEDVSIPEIKPNEVLVRMAFCGVCGSDIPRIFTKGTYTFPTIPGHEFAGTVARLGAAVSGIAVGDRVAVFPLIWCGQCPGCELGRYAQCDHYDYLGSRSDGAFADYVRAPARNLMALPTGVSFEAGAMAEPAAVALHAIRRGGGLTAGETVAVFGAGPIGILVAQWARALGAERVALFDVDPDKLRLAASLGFAITSNPAEHDPIRVIEDHTKGAGAHLVIEAAGVPQTFRQAIEAAATDGRVVIMGNPSADVTLPPALVSRALRREITIAGTWNSTYRTCGSDDDWRVALSAMASGRLELDPLISHRVPLSAGVGALTMIRDRMEFTSKVLLYPDA